MELFLILLKSEAIEYVSTFNKLNDFEKYSLFQKLKKNYYTNKNNLEIPSWVYHNRNSFELAENIFSENTILDEFLLDFSLFYHYSSCLEF